MPHPILSPSQELLDYIGDRIVVAAISAERTSRDGISSKK